MLFNSGYYQSPVDSDVELRKLLLINAKTAKTSSGKIETYANYNFTNYYGKFKYKNPRKSYAGYELDEISGKIKDVEKMPKYDYLGNNGMLSVNFLNVDVKKLGAKPVEKTVNDILKKDNFLIGSSFDDYLSAGGGNDTLGSVAGMDILTGGGGKDTFALIHQSGFAKVTDFSVKKDSIVTAEDPKNLSWSKDKNYSYLYDKNNNLIAYFSNKPNLGKAKYYRFDEMKSLDQFVQLGELDKGKLFGTAVGKRAVGNPRETDFVMGGSAEHELDKLLIGNTMD
jgi:hypothetical protein